MLELIYKMQPLDYVYLLVGIILFIFAIQSFLDKEHKYRIGTGLFWLLYSVSFIFGSYLSKEINGWLVIVMAAIVLVKQLGKGHYFESPIEFKKDEAVRIGNVIFVPALLVGIITFIIGFFTKLGALVGIGIAAIIAKAAKALPMIIVKMTIPMQYATTTRNTLSAGTTLATALEIILPTPAKLNR